MLNDILLSLADYKPIFTFNVYLFRIVILIFISWRDFGTYSSNKFKLEYLLRKNYAKEYFSN
jgi:tellurite resistance protein TehA-like permease